MIQFLAWFAIGIAAGTVIGSFFERTVHRLSLRTPLQGEAAKARRTRAENRVTGAWWTGLACVSIGLMPFVVTAFIMQRWGIFCGITVACTLYYGLYERAHWRAHLPKAKLTECERILGRVNAGRAFHHRCRSRNSNAVLPLAESFSGIPRLELALPCSTPRLPSVPHGKPNRKRFNHAPGQSNAEWKLQNAETNS